MTGGHEIRSQTPGPLSLTVRLSRVGGGEVGKGEVGNEISVAGVGAPGRGSGNVADDAPGRATYDTQESVWGGGSRARARAEQSIDFGNYFSHRFWIRGRWSSLHSRQVGMAGIALEWNGLEWNGTGVRCCDSRA